ncbi:MAG: transcription antitermination factor NusB [Planctomycetota bacterium]|nr:MAG: transcription antitermination factor NusB [Planctomycetota bacterium]
MIDRRASRILAMQALCQMESLGEDFLAQLDDFLADEGHPAGVQEYARGLVRDCWSHREALDARLQAVAEHWATRRMAMVDRNILRVSACELMHRRDIPPAVVINEAVEIARAFSGAESPGFINGVLDAVRKGLDAPPAAPVNPLSAALEQTHAAQSGMPAGGQGTN